MSISDYTKVKIVNSQIGTPQQVSYFIVESLKSELQAGIPEFY